MDIKISNTAVERVYDTKFLGVYIDAQLTWKRHIEYTCSKLSKCAGILLKAKQKCSNVIILFICISIFHLLQSVLGEHIPHRPGKNGFTAEKTGTSCYMFSSSCPYWTIHVSQPITIYTWRKRLCSWYFYVELCDPEATANLPKINSTETEMSMI